MSQLAEVVSIPEYFSGKTIFVTGATGFIGKLLIEKLLRNCPDISKIYVLIRARKGKSPEERIKGVLDLPIFDKIKQTRPDNLKKIVPVVGDVVELGLGLTEQDKQTLIDEVNIVYHGAASVRFDDPLKDATILNTRGTRETVLLSKQFKHLEVFVHISTSYCNSDRHVIGERLYPPHADWKETIEIAEKVDSHTIDILTQKYIDPLPNTYTFTKSLAEHVVADLCEGEIPVVITRPSIVINTVEEPIPGWIDNFNGPVGILVASGKGILRSVYTDPDIVPDYVPVDVVIKALLISVWQKSLIKNKEEKLKGAIYNFSNNKINNVTIGEMVDMGKDICWNYPLNDVLWYPNGGVTSWYYYHYLRLIFYHLIPAVLVDVLLRILGRKPMLFKIQRKIYIANMALQYFIMQEWVFENEKSNSLDQNLLPTDQKDFTFPRNADKREFFTNSLWGARKYLLKEDDSTFEAAKRHSRRMWVLKHIVDFVTYFVVFYLFFVKWNILQWVWGVIYDYFEKV